MTEPTEATGLPIPAPETGIRVGFDDGLLRLTIDRPERKGALDPVAVRAMVEVLEAAAIEDRMRAVLIASAGDDFCSGADVVRANRGNDDPSVTKPRPGNVARRTALQGHRLITLLTEVQVPVVAAVRGWAAGLGCGLALAADFTVAAEGASFWLPFTTRGFTPDSGTTWVLPRLIGLARAKEAAMLGRPIPAVDAAAWGMIHRAVPDGELDGYAEALAIELRDGPTVALGLTKRCLHNALDGGMIAAMEHELVAVEVALRTRDFKEGLAAFAERRDPDFTGR